MPLTPETLVRHELNGLPVRVVESDDEGRVGLEGRVVLETTNTLSIATRVEGEERVLTVPKSGSTFEFAITDDTAGDGKSPGTASKLATYPDAVSDRAAGETGGSDHAGEDVAYVTVDGSRLLSRPARRTETSGDSPWQ